MEHKIFDKHNLKRLSEVLKEVWEEMPETEPDFLEEYAADRQKENEKRISRMMEQGKERLGEYPRSFFAVRKRRAWKKRTEGWAERILQEEPLLDMGGVLEGKELEKFQICMKTFLRKVREFDKDLTLPDMGQAVRNYMVYAIFLALNGMELKYRPAAFGYSMLYPYTDNYIDSPERTGQEKEHYNRLIEDKLKGKQVRPLSRHEKKTVELLEQVETDYGRPHEVYDGLLLMLEAQEKSLKQGKRFGGGVSEAEALGVSVYKGGVSVLMDRYFIDKPFTEQDLYFYYGFGFLLQLCDDLQDIAQDKREGNPTVFSLCGTKQEATVKVNKLLHFARKLFESCDTEKQEFKAFLQKNCYLLVLASAAGSVEWMAEEWMERMERSLPVRSGYLRDYGIGMLGSGRQEDGKKEGKIEGKKEGKKNRREHTRYMRMLDVLLSD